MLSIKKTKIASAIFAVASITTLSLTIATVASALPVAVDLGSASNWAVLAGSGITNTGATTVSGSAGGDMGSSPTGTFTGSVLVTTSGTKFTSVNSQTTGAKADLVLAYNDAAGRTGASPVVADIGGRTLTAGVYSAASSMGLTGTVILDGEDDPNAVFIFQAGSTLTTASNSVVQLTRGAQACNVFWQVGSSATFGTTTDFVGHVLALTSITANSGATFDGSLLARNGAVTLNNNTIVNDVCAGASPSPSASAAASEAPTPEATTETGGELPNTDATDWMAPLFAGLALAATGSIVYFARRRRA